jgi:hypothetical protein
METGYADLIIGAPSNHSRRGAAYVYSGRDGKILLALTGERQGDQFGSAVTGFTSKAGTLLLAAAAQAGDQHHGRVYVLKSLGR